MALHSAWPAGTPRIHWTFAPKTPEISRSEHEGDEVGDRLLIFKRIRLPQFFLPKRLTFAPQFATLGMEYWELPDGPADREP